MPNPQLARNEEEESPGASFLDYHALGTRYTTAMRVAQWTRRTVHVPALPDTYVFIEHVSPVEAEFRDCVEMWRSETLTMSSVTEIVLHPAYQRIIGMGLRALPYIFDELEREPGHWLWALRAITGVDPAVKTETLDAARDAWLGWRRSTRAF